MMITIKVKMIITRVCKIVRVITFIATAEGGPKPDPPWVASKGLLGLRKKSNIRA